MLFPFFRISEVRLSVQNPNHRDLFDVTHAHATFTQLTGPVVRSNHHLEPLLKCWDSPVYED